MAPPTTTSAAAAADNNNEAGQTDGRQRKAKSARELGAPKQSAVFML